MPRIAKNGTVKAPVLKSVPQKAPAKSNGKKENVLSLLRVEENDRMSLLLAASESQRLSAQADLAVAQADKLIADLDRDGRVRDALATAQRFRAAQQLAEQKYFAVMKGVEAKLGISLEKYAMNPDTGIVRPIDTNTPSVDSGHPT
jgi:hypothetical protein